MPFCRCGELSNEDKCKKCGYNLLSSSTENRHSMVDRWQSRYLGSIVGLDSISPPAKDDTNNNKRTPFSPISQRASSIYKDLTNPLSSLLDHRRSKLRELKSKDLFASPSEQPATEKPENSCQECYKKLSGKLVRIPNSQVRYHWGCLKCESCKGVFENTSFIIDSSKKVYHPKCAMFLSPLTTCSRCSLVISEKYIAVNSSVLHLKCFRCTGCQKVLQPSSIYTDDQGYFCQHCTNNKPLCDQEQLSNHMKIVPQPQTISKNSSTTFDNSLLYEDNLSDTASVSSDSDLINSYSKMSVSTPKSRYSYSPANRRVAPKIDVVKPSSLMSSRGRPLPRFGVIRDCPRCNERIDSVHDEIPGPKASRWHKKCLSCTGCSKMLDSGTNVQEDKATGRLNPWCTTCILNKKDRKGPVMTKV